MKEETELVHSYKSFTAEDENIRMMCTTSEISTSFQHLSEI